MLGSNCINVTVETNKGNVSLCMDNFGIHLCYPLGIGISESIVKDILGVDEGFIKYNSAGLQIPRVIEEDNMLSKITLCGGKKTNSISILFYKKDDNVVNQLIDNIELYECFICLMLEICKFMGDIKAINMNSDSFKHTPESLASEGCNPIELYPLRDLFYYAKEDKREIILSEVYNSERWMCVIRYKVSDDVGASKIAELLSENL